MLAFRRLVPGGVSAVQTRDDEVLYMELAPLPGQFPAHGKESGRKGKKCAGSRKRAKLEGPQTFSGVPAGQR